MILILICQSSPLHSDFFFIGIKGWKTSKLLFEWHTVMICLLRLDMEDHRVTDDTIQVMLDMHEKGLTNVGVVLQGRLFRTLDDIQAIAEKLGPNADYRICKGIYLEPSEISHTELSTNYRRYKPKYRCNAGFRSICWNCKPRPPGNQSHSFCPRKKGHGAK